MRRHPIRRNTRLALARETLLRLTEQELSQAVVGGGTLTYEGSCDNSLCPCPTQTGELG